VVGRCWELSAPGTATRAALVPLDRPHHEFHRQSAKLSLLRGPRELIVSAVCDKGPAPGLPDLHGVENAPKLSPVPPIAQETETDRRPVTAKVVIAVVLLSGGVGAVLGSVFPPENLMARIYPAANQPAPASEPPSATAIKPPAKVGGQSASATLQQSSSISEPVSVLFESPPPDQAVSPEEQLLAVDEPIDAAEKPERKPARHRRASQERTAPAKQKQFAATSNAAPAKSPGSPSPAPSIATRLSEQWWQ
jgi:hypothetical protein